MAPLIRMLEDTVHTVDAVLWMVSGTNGENGI